MQRVPMNPDENSGVDREFTAGVVFIGAYASGREFARVLDRIRVAFHREGITDGVQGYVTTDPDRLVLLRNVVEG